MKKLILLSTVLSAILLVVPSCKDDEKDINQPETPLITEGQIVTSEFSKDGLVIERMVDTVVNFGRAEAPVLFYVNSEHTLNGVPIQNGNQHGNVFRSLSRNDLNNFIVIWGQLYGIEIDPDDHSQGAIEKRQRAFHMLQEFLMGNDLDLPILVALAKDTLELGSARRIVEAANAANSLKRGNITANNPEILLRTFEKLKVNPSVFSKVVHDQGFTEKSFLAFATMKGADIGQYMNEAASTKQIGVAIVAGVVWATKLFTKLTIRLIENQGPVVDIDNDYSSYLHDSDLVVTHYIADPTPEVSPTYSVAYCTLATCSFYMEVYYKAKHSILPGTYVARSSMIVQSVRCSWGMHVTGDITYDVGFTDGTDENPVAYSNGTVIIKYGDCCCNSRSAELDYQVRGDTGYSETNWEDK